MKHLFTTFTREIFYLSYAECDVFIYLFQYVCILFSLFSVNHTISFQCIGTCQYWVTKKGSALTITCPSIDGIQSSTCACIMEQNVWKFFSLRILLAFTVVFHILLWDAVIFLYTDIHLFIIAELVSFWIQKYLKVPLYVMFVLSYIEIWLNWQGKLQQCEDHRHIS